MPCYRDVTVSEANSIISFIMDTANKRDIITECIDDSLNSTLNIMKEGLERQALKLVQTNKDFRICNSMEYAAIKTLREHNMEFRGLVIDLRTFSCNVFIKKELFVPRISNNICNEFINDETRIWTEPVDDVTEGLFRISSFIEVLKHVRLRNS